MLDQLQLVEFFCAQISRVIQRPLRGCCGKHPAQPAQPVCQF